jgi:hypothetical protein
MKTRQKLRGTAPANSLKADSALKATMARPFEVKIS